MARLMSVSHTTDAVIERRKTVTRRLGWLFLKPGDRLTLCRKVMGRKPGEPLERLAEVEVISVTRVVLAAFPMDDLEREGVPEATYLPRAFDGYGYQMVTSWVWWFAKAMGCKPDAEVTRIEWRYL